MATRFHDANFLEGEEYSEEHSQQSQQTVASGAVSSRISRGDLKGVINDSESSATTNNLRSRMNESSTDSYLHSQSTHTKLTSNVDSIYGYYKKKGDDDGAEEPSMGSQHAESSRHISHFDNNSHVGNYVPANKMLDLRLLNAEINAGMAETPRRSGKSTKNKGEKAAPIEIFSFKQTPAKRAYQGLNQEALWKSDPLNRKYNLELSAQKVGEDVDTVQAKRKARHVIDDEEENKEGDKQSFGAVYSSRQNLGPAGIRQVFDYAKTGIYIDPNQISRKTKSKKKSSGRDIKYAIKDLEAASFMDADDFLGGGFGTPAPPSPKMKDEEAVDDEISTQELQKNTKTSLEQQAKVAMKKQKRFVSDIGMPTFRENLEKRKSLFKAENQDYTSKINIFYKDMKYPIYDLARVCPPPSASHSIIKAHGSAKKADMIVSQRFRQSLLGIKEADSEDTQSLASQKATPEKESPHQFRVLAIERRFGMTTLIVANSDKKTFSKILLSPVFDEVKIWQGDKVEVGELWEYPLRSAGPNSFDFLDEYFISRILVARRIQNLSLRTDADTSTEMEATVEATAPIDTASVVGSQVNSQLDIEDSEMRENAEMKEDSEMKDSSSELL